METERRRKGGSSQKPQGLWAQGELAASCGKDAVRPRDRARGADAAAGRDFEVACVHRRLVARQLGSPQGAGDVRPTIHHLEPEPQWKPEERLHPARRREPRQSCVRDPLREADVHVEPERCGDLVLKDLSEAAPLRIHPAQDLAFVETQRDGVIRLARPRRPCRRLPGQHLGQPVQIRDETAVHRHIEREERRVMREQLTDGDRRLAVLGELRPVRAHGRLVVEPAPRMRKGHGHRGEALRRGVDEDHGVRLPRLACPRVPHAAPKIDDLFAVEVGTAGAAELAAAREIFREDVADVLEARADVPFNRDVM